MITAKTIINEATSFVIGSSVEQEHEKVGLVNQAKDFDEPMNDEDDDSDDNTNTDDSPQPIRNNSINNSSIIESESIGNAILLSDNKSDHQDASSTSSSSSSQSTTSNDPSAELKQRVVTSSLSTSSEKRPPILPKNYQYSLHSYDNLPAYLQGNEYIQTGYRVNFSYRLCIKSLFRIHNETLNIWTHLLATVMFFILMIVTLEYILVDPSPTDKFIFTVFFLCAQAQMLFSAIFHTFCSVSSRSYLWFARLDYCGISLMIVGSYYPILYYLLKCHPTARIVYMTAISILGVVGISVSMLTFFQSYRFRTMRAIFFIVFGFFILIPLPQIIALEGIAYVWPAFWRLSLVGASYVIGATIYASRCPECCAPGKFDNGFSSHPIWHLFTIVAALLQLYGCIFSFNHYGSRC
ncbi:hypothetical protein SAMD00019534_008860 [Acytostelium subglobosum LB1]|uniref:hypothetical protein n=1 Tax=Acytostelium subglobosum LB1 TaxID=1410327 RepID=UPI000644F397|nr:hypothetical protein SAMD00019534_008860 [Acytostelium subglobosum LB1]GAM17711.1 hypothetical protein SAMD00019534_008860 [Acytostelium subglobosum LB1]|eukprot:XP_012758307.1 hypothetical protein SAMD00019534_008860 [Acytostelium subglobosum LB1]